MAYDAPIAPPQEIHQNINSHIIYHNSPEGARVGFKRIPGKAQYGGSDYTNAVRVERGITLQEALDIAASDPEIDYFFIMKDLQMVLNFVPGQVYEPEKDPLHLVQYGNMRIFRYGDAVFFKKEGQWLGDAGPFADVYEKVQSSGQVSAAPVRKPPVPRKESVEFKHMPGVAQYKGSDYSNAVRVERGITVEKAKEIAANDPKIDYFFIVTGWSMVLEFEPGQTYDLDKDPLHLVTESAYVFDNGRPGYGYMRYFRHGDVVFFNNDQGQKWLGTAPGLADVYEKVKSS